MSACSRPGTVARYIFVVYAAGVKTLTPGESSRSWVRRMRMHTVAMRCGSQAAVPVS